MLDFLKVILGEVGLDMGVPHLIATAGLDHSGGTNTIPGRGITGESISLYYRPVLAVG